MIELTIEDFILWMISLPMVMIGLHAIWANMKRRASINSARRHIVNCRVCGNLYQDRSRERHPACPECGRANQRGRSRRLG